MRVHHIAAALFVALAAAGCSGDGGSGAAKNVARDTSASNQQPSQFAALPATIAPIASLPDRGSLVEYRAGARRVAGGTIYPVAISEAHARHAIAAGGMVFRDPDGKPIPIKFSAQVPHGDGNWSWVGHAAGAAGSAVITFGKGAVFGSIPRAGGEPLQIAMAGGRPVVMVPDANSALRPGDVGAETDFVDARIPRGPQAAASAARPAVHAAASAPIAATAAAAGPVPATNTVDLLLGYTSGFASRLGGSAQAVTRLHYLVDLGNQAYIDSGVSARLNLVGTVQVDYADATSNSETLFQLSGLSCSNSVDSLLRTPDNGEACTPAATPAALAPLIAARDRYGADLVSLVRNYSSPENGSCGVGWLIGAGQQPVTVADARYGLSVVSDSGGTQFPSNGQVCREEYLVHEIGHNMGLQHDIASAAGSDDTDGNGNTLDAVEFGAFADAFGYRTDASNGNFYTIMALRSSGQTGYRVFANPALTTCGGFACGMTGTADNARVLGITVPIIASFRSAKSTTVWVRADFNADGKADILWRNTATGDNMIWLSGNQATTQAVESVDTAWFVAGVGDFNGDGRADILWRNSTSGANVLWPSGQKTGRQVLPTVAPNWSVAAVADFTGDHRADLLWRDGTSGANALWPSADRNQRQTLGTVADANWSVAAAADFNLDGRADILWRNAVTGANVKWPAAKQNFKVTLPTVDASWHVAGSADFNADGHADVLWRNGSSGANVIWLSADRSTRQTASTVSDTNWDVAGAGDFNGDGSGDVLWRNGTTGANTIWLSANQSTKQTVAALVDLSWIVGG